VVYVRYGLPLVLVLAGLVCLFALPTGSQVEAWAMFTGAGMAVLLLNWLYRIGVSGDTERDREEAARDYFEQHGRWPDEEERPAGRKWKLPEGIMSPEEEAAGRDRRNGG
jgi:hypothetical protein